MDFVLRVLPNTWYEPPISFPFSKWASAARSVPLKNCTYANKRAFFLTNRMHSMCCVLCLSIAPDKSGFASCRLCPSMSSASSVFRPYGLQTPETGLLTFHPSKKGLGGALRPISLIRPSRLIRLIRPICQIGPIKLITSHPPPYTLHRPFWSLLVSPVLPASSRWRPVSN